MKKYIIALFFFCLLIFNSVSAVELPAINKSKIRLSIVPGQSDYGEIVIENTSEDARSMRVYLSDWYYLPDANGSKEFVPANTTPQSCASWITFSPAEFTLGPFGKQKVNYSVRVPEGASGGHYAGMFFESVFGKLESQQKEFKAGMNIVIRIATLFYIEPKGTIKREALIDNLVIKKEKDGFFAMQLDFKNTGNVDITCGGTFHIMDGQGLVLARGEFNDVFTFPGGAAKLSGVCKERLSPGKYDLVLTFDLGKALEEDNFGRGPVVTKETGIEVEADGSVSASGLLK